MKKTFMGIAILLALVVAFTGRKILVKNIRTEYPYTGISTKETTDSLMDGDVINNYELERLVSKNDMAIEGHFTGEKQLIEVAIVPEEGTNEYTVTQSLAEEFGKSFEEMVPKIEYYKLEFIPNSTLYYSLSEPLTETIFVYIQADDWDVFPDPSQYQNAILFANDFPYGGEHAVLASTLGYYYISDEGDVYSAEKFKGLDQYSGNSLKEFSTEVTNLRSNLLR